MEPAEPIAIVGSACRFPGNVSSPSALWDLLVNPKDVVSPIPNDRFSSQGFYHKNGQYHGHTNVNKSYLLSGENNVRRFDAQFFGFPPLEANSLDPQVRLLLETVFEALEDGGQPMESLRGSETAVYSGVMASDYEHMLSRDEDAIPNHYITGTARSLISNRISYFFDWHGPSMTIDTACSSSLYAIHYAVQQLRSGASQVAVATGTNLLLDPVGYIGESKLQMLSPSGRCRMWDGGADGYARGEGVAAVVMKTVTQAEKDGDYIHCIIRETAVNQDGRTRSITVPSAKAQSKLITTCYQRAGLDTRKMCDHPQYFEAHGTGTPTGDPIEAEAISSVFALGRSDEDIPLYVGSIKTVVGHTEGTAGLAGILKASLALQHAIIPPNLLFENLNPSVTPFYRRLCIPTVASRWPSVPNGMPRRASVNSFGFGGANAHAILESYHGSSTTDVPVTDYPTFAPFIFSAPNNLTLSRNLERFCDFLDRKGAVINMQQLAHTLHSRRTRFHVVVSFTASTVKELSASIKRSLVPSKQLPISEVQEPRLGIQDGHVPKVICVFTGQGAQWPRMGAELVAQSASCRAILKKLDARLARLPEPPIWSLLEELERPASSSRINEAEISQPLCTAIQIMLVDIMRKARIPIFAAVGHSSGEIAAAYAQGIISADDAICIAYYRGFYTKLSKRNGAMLAVGSSQDDVQGLLEEDEFIGRVSIAAVNSSNSVTLSGYADAIHEVEAILKDEKKFARILRVDQAYHSHLMAECSLAYLRSLALLEISSPAALPTTWSSSTYGGAFGCPVNSLAGPYWDLNLQNPVKFMQAVRHSCNTNGKFDLAIEVGPHPALKAPFLQNVQETFGHEIPYTSLLRRGSNDLHMLAEGLGYITSHLGRGSVDFMSFETFMIGGSTLPLRQELPPYLWNHDYEYWFESRNTKAVLQRSDSVHPLLGHLCPNSTHENMSWRNMLRPRELRWLEDHRIQGQMVFPGAGYIVAALEACLKSVDFESISTVHVSDITFSRALMFDSTESEKEIVTYLTDIQRNERINLTAKFSFNAAKNNSDRLEALASGSVQVWMRGTSSESLPSRSKQATNLMRSPSDEFYGELSKIGYNYTGPFRALNNVQRKLGAATGMVSNIHGSEFVIHPATLDAAFQSIFLAASAPGDGQLTSIHLPTGIRHLTFDVSSIVTAQKQDTFDFDAYQSKDNSMSGDVNIIDSTTGQIMVQVEGLECQPLVSTTPANDKTLYSKTVWVPLLPDAERVVSLEKAAEEQAHTGHQLERISWFYLNKLEKAVPKEHYSRKRGPYNALFDFIAHSRLKHSTRGYPWWHKQWEKDSIEDINSLYNRKTEVVEFKLLRALGEQMVEIVKGEVVAIEVAMQDNILSDYYQHGLGISKYTEYLSHVVAQLAARFPHLNCLEVGAGTGGATRAIFRGSKRAFSSYTFTDISPGFFGTAEAQFGGAPAQMIYKSLDININPAEQGFEEHSYDVVVASLVLHTTISLRETLRNIRRLLKPGGYLVALELRKDLPVRWTAIFGCFPGWWIGSDDGRHLSPCIEIEEWDILLRECGFSGCDTATPKLDSFTEPLAVFVSQAVDDKISFLRNPLAHLNDLHILEPNGAFSELLILGLGGDKHLGSIDRWGTLFRSQWSSIKTVRTLEELGTIDLSSTTMVLSLIELDRPIFQGMISNEWEHLKHLFHSPSNILWITSGRRAIEPYANMTVGVARVVRNETISLNIQFMDIEDRDQVDIALLEAFVMRFRASILSTDDQENWAFVQFERELIVTPDGRILVQRLVPDEAMNDRYNSCHRTIKNLTNLRESEIALSQSPSGYILQAAQPHNGRYEDDREQTEITHSLSAPITIYGQVVYLVAGRKGDSDPFVGMSSCHTSLSTRSTTFMCPVKLASGEEAKFLTLASQISFVHNHLRGLDGDDHILILEPPEVLMKFLSRTIQKIGLRCTYITCLETILPGCRGLHPSAPDRELDSLDLSSVVVFIDFSQANQTARIVDRILSSASRWCKYASLHDEYFREPSATAKSNFKDDPRFQNLLENVVSQTSELLSQYPSKDISFDQVSLQNLCETGQKIKPGSIVHWSRNEDIEVNVRPIDSSNIFSSEKTYWLVGLTGSLGVSLCEWMIHRGARFIVLSSRKPKVENRWQEEMANLGATVWVRSCDISIARDIMELYNEICEKLPAIAGVAQGAMVLKDAHMSDLEYESFSQVTLPKVEGSLHLDHLFRDHDLDFFIFLSSISSIIGIPGQSAYAAANMFMIALAEQRRQRGLAASVINIGAVLGAGYISQMGLDTSTSKRAMGFRSLSVRDFFQLFAEAVLADGREGITEINAGIALFAQNETPQPKWASNPIMTHLIINTTETTELPKDVISQATFKMQLLEANSLRKVYTLVQNEFYKVLEGLLQLNSDMIKTISVDTRLDELGIDSILALEIRAWLMENLRFNYPVLKILGGITIGELLSASIENIDVEIAPNVEHSPAHVSTLEVSEPVVLPSPYHTQSSGEIESSSTSGSETSLDAPSSTRSLRSSANNENNVILATADLSPTQTMFWSALNIFEDKTSLNFSAFCSIEGAINIERLKKSLRNVGQRHEVLRTCFLNHEGVLLQGIMKDSPLRLEHEWINDQYSLKQRVKQVKQHIYRPESGELMRLLLVSTTTTSHFLIFGASHLCMDGVSVRIFLVDLFKQYHGQSLQSSVTQFKDYAQAKQAEFEAGKFEHEFKFWQTQYHDFPPPIPILSVSRVTLRPTLECFRSATVEARIALDTKTRVSSVCRRYRATPFHFHLAVLRVLISRFSDADDVAVGTVDSGRNDDNVESLGVYANVIPLRFRARASDKFENVLQETRNATLEALANSGVPFQSIIERLKPPRSPSSTPIFQCLLNYRPGQRRAGRWGELKVDLVSLEVSNTGYDLSLDVVDDAEQDCLLTLAFNENLYSKDEAQTLISVYTRLVHELSINPDTDIMEPNIYDEGGVTRALELGSGQFKNLNWQGTIQKRVEELSKLTPGAAAIKYSGGKIATYSELAAMTDNIAARLRDVGVTPGTMVATLQEPTALWIASMLAIMKTGSIYVPLDMSLSTDRLGAILGNCRAEWILVDHESDTHFQKIEHSHITTLNVAIEYKEKIPWTERRVSENSAMVLYTSGSTNTPKGIILQHTGIMNLIESVGSIYNLNRSTCALQQSASTFDMCYAQIFMSLGYGGSVVLLPRNLRGDSLSITEIIARERITFTNATPTEYSSWLRYGNIGLMQKSQWQTAISGGEHVRTSLLQQFQDLNLSTLRLFNSYGPTEITWGVTSGELLHGKNLTRKSDLISAGHVLPNYSIYLIDARFRPVAVGLPGEIYVGGPGVAAGYLDDSNLNSERFIKDTFAPRHLTINGWKNMHRTGDIGRWNQDGTLIIEGRIGNDTQIKLRGFRFDLHDVEQAIINAAAGSVTEAIVSVRASSPDGPEFLVAHVKFDQSVEMETKAQLLRSLPFSLQLPHYMVPLMVLSVDEFPRTTSSKLDRRAVSLLPLPESNKDTPNGDVELDEVQERLRDIWLSILPVTPPGHITSTTDFFHVGGTSLILVQLQAELKKQLGMNIQLAKLLKASMLRSMALLLEGKWELEPINWDAETALSDIMKAQLVKTSFVVPTSPSVVALTGATGFLGREILDVLLADEGVSEVHCIGIRTPRKIAHLAMHEKVFLYEGDIRLESLGLSDETASKIFGRADCIIHAAADISHRRAYHSLRAANFESLKQLVLMSLPRKIPLHYVSTSQVGILYSAHTGQEKFPEVSIRHCKPPTDGTDGYTATKWAAESFLEQLSTECRNSWPIFVHRPALILRLDRPGESIMHNIAHFSSMMGVRPLLDNYRGYLNTVSLNTVVSGIVSAIKEPVKKAHEMRTLSAIGLQFRHHTDGRKPALLHELNRSDLPTVLGGLGSSIGPEFETLPASDWAIKAGTLGLAPEIVQWVETAGMTGIRSFPRLLASWNQGNLEEHK